MPVGGGIGDEPLIGKCDPLGGGEPLGGEPLGGGIGDEPLIGGCEPLGGGEPVGNPGKNEPVVCIGCVLAMMAQPRQKLLRRPIS